jgi:hypothetical protein
VKTPKVRLYIRIRRSDGTDAFVDPAWNRNRTLREGYALVEGQPEHHLEGIYYLRFLRNGKRVWEAVGSDANTAIVALRNTEHDLQSIALGIHGDNSQKVGYVLYFVTFPQPRRYVSDTT